MSSTTHGELVDSLHDVIDYRGELVDSLHDVIEYR